MKIGIALSILAFITQPTWAGDGGETLRPPSTAALDLGKDDSNATFGGLNLDLSLNSGDTIFFSFSSNRVENQATGEKDVIRSFAAGYTIDPGAKFSFTPSVANWGARSDLITRSLLFDTTVTLENWSFGLQPELKSLIWVSQIEPDKKVRTNAFGMHFHVDYVGLKNWLFQLRAGRTNYGGERFDNFVYSYYVTDSAFAQSTGLVKNYSSLGASHQIFAWTIGLSAQNTVYIVGGLRSKSITADLRYQVSSAWTAGYSYSSSRTEDASKTQTNALNLSYCW